MGGLQAGRSRGYFSRTCWWSTCLWTEGTEPCPVDVACSLVWVIASQARPSTPANDILRCCKDQQQTEDLLGHCKDPGDDCITLQPVLLIDLSHWNIGCSRWISNMSSSHVAQSLLLSSRLCEMCREPYLAGLPFTLCTLPSSDHQFERHGGHHVQEAGEGTRLLRDQCGGGERGAMRLPKCVQSFQERHRRVQKLCLLMT